MARSSPASRRSARSPRVEPGAPDKIDRVMHEWGGGGLHSGSKHGPSVPHTKKGRKQAIAIALSEQRKANRGG